MSQQEPRFYGRRHGKKLRPNRKALLADLLPSLRLPDTDPIETANLFDPPVAQTWLEIGFGAGEHLAAQAAAHRDIGFIGCEPYVNGVAALLARIDADGLTNIRLYDDDVRPLLPRIAAGAIDRVYLMYSDPWPKKRHWNRRFVQTETLDALARILRPGGLFRVATDHMDHARWVLWHTLRHPAFGWTARGPEDWRRRPTDGFPTRYEEKALAAGSACVYLDFARVAD